MSPVPTQGVTGIVLAGGRSSRFASESSAGGSKLDADLLGRTVLQRSIDSIATCCDDVVLVGRSGPGRPGVHFLDDPEPFEGPLAGLAVGLAATVAPIALVIAGDMPLAQPGILRTLVDSVRLDARAMRGAVLADGSGWRPLPTALRRPGAAEVARLALVEGERSLRGFLRRLELLVVGEDRWRAIDPDGDSLLDIDTPDDLVAAARRLRGA